MPAIDHDLATALVVHAGRLVRAVRRDLELPAVTRVVSLLDEHGPLGITQLATLDRCSQPTMSAAVAQLTERGWVTKQPNAEDARGTDVALTDAGRAELGRVRRLYGERIGALVAAHPTLTTEDLATAVAVLRGVLGAGSTEKGNS